MNRRRRNLKVEMNWLARNAQPDDLVVIYIATHGSPRSMDTVGANYFVPYDTEIGEEGDPDLLFATAFPMVDVSSVVASRIRATRFAVFLDTCYSEGALVDGKGAAATKPGSSAVAGSAISVQTLDHIRQGAYVQEHVSSGVTQDFKAYGWHQDPVMSRSEPDTDFTLGEPAASTVALAGARDKVIEGSAGRHGPV